MKPAARKAIRVLGTRGIPGCHGGFESFLEDLAPFLASNGWDVTVYCQADRGEPREDSWRGVRLVSLPVRHAGARGTIEFDWKSTRHAAAAGDPVLVLGYNTALFSTVYRLSGIPSLLNMDGLEWKRQKYNLAQRGWLLLNEWVGSRMATHLIADHPLIGRRYARWPGVRGVTTIPYGSRTVQKGQRALIEPWHLLPDGYAIVIARPEPENYILEMVRAYSERPRGRPLLVLGSYDKRVPYQRRVLDAASADVLFPGPIYDRDTVDALRFFATLYLHGHHVGGTNPSLVEALGAGNAVLAHANGFNRWVCGDAAAYFLDEAGLGRWLDRLLDERHEPERTALRARARQRHTAQFDLHRCLSEYERVLATVLGVAAADEAPQRSAQRSTVA